MDQRENPPFAPDVTSVGQLAGLRPRRRPRDGGEVPGADVEVVDALDLLTRRTVLAWLHDRPSVLARQTSLQVLASFLRWLHTIEPALEPLAVTGAHLDAYCYAALTGGLKGGRSPGKPLAPATVAKKRAVLSSFYAFAGRCGVVRHDRLAASQAAKNGRALTREERRLLRQGIARLAAEGRPAEAAAVALLDATGTSSEALAGLTAQDLHIVGGWPAIITVHHDRDDIVAFPVPALARPLLRTLCSSRPAGEPLIRRADGHPVDLEWLRAALTDAALAGGIPERRAKLLHPHLMRATPAAELPR
ncbi:hypothetical protein ACTMTI_25075 [Nonomuraea sp. H19]|uniref:hypothetical protein n=1 Tax=Nonomuraea sp. H19 TaxID=3452206 RepID=UPI003F88E0B7